MTIELGIDCSLECVFSDDDVIVEIIISIGVTSLDITDLVLSNPRAVDYIYKQLFEAGGSEQILAERKQNDH